MTIRGIVFCLTFFLCSATISCSSDDDTPPIEKLPKATQTGAGTFGCLVNGRPFMHNDGLINCFYQYVDDGYYFGITGSNFDYKDVVGVFLGTQKKMILEEQTYSLLSREPENAYAGGEFRISATNSKDAKTNIHYTGEITITKLDFDNHIVSGTFWFNVKHPVTGDTVEIRKGRFDSHFGG